MILSYFRTIFFYLILIAIVRLMGKRQLGQMEPSEFVVTMLVSNLAAIPMQDGGIPLYTGIIPIFTVLALELILSGIALKSLGMRKLLCGNPVILIEKGQILQKNLSATRITLDELLGLLRCKNILDPRLVQYAILETGGELSVFPYPDQLPATAQDAGISPTAQTMPLPLISDGHILEENLKKAGKDRNWLEHTLQAHRCTLKNTWLLALDGQGSTLFYRKEN